MIHNYIDSENNSMGRSRSEVIAEFSAELSKAGLIVGGEPIGDGVLHRVPVVGDRPGKTSGSYVLHIDERPAGHIQNWKQGIKQPWRADGQRSPVDSAIAEKISHATAVTRLARHARQVEAAVGARQLIAMAQSATRHPYLARKNVAAHGLFIGESGRILMPLADVDGEIWNVQKINRDGSSKRFLKGGRVEGLFHAVGDVPKAETVVIVEGYATGATIFEATGLPVAIACNAGNLKAVCENLRVAYPRKIFVVAGDNDQHLTSMIDADGNPKLNVGLIKAQEAAFAIDAITLIPSFPVGSVLTDWNDYASAFSYTEVREIFSAAL